MTKFRKGKKVMFLFNNYHSIKIFTGTVHKQTETVVKIKSKLDSPSRDYWVIVNILPEYVKLYNEEEFKKFEKLTEECQLLWLEIDDKKDTIIKEFQDGD